MRRLLIATAVSLATAATAFAADLPVAMPTKAPAYVPAYSWTGLYIGGNAGGAWGTFDPSTSTVWSPTGYFAPTSVPAVNAAGMQSIKPAGFTGGFEAGYNWQVTNFVLGFEGDIDTLQLRGSANSGFVTYPFFAPTGFVINSSASTTWLATIRGRLGYAFDRWLVYATGGAAFTRLNGTFTFNDTFAPATESATLANTKTGYTVGGGVEAALWDRWSVKAEYLYVNFGTVSTMSTNLAGFAPPVAFPATVFTHSIDLKASIARLGLNYRF